MNHVPCWECSVGRKKDQADDDEEKRLLEVSQRASLDDRPLTAEEPEDTTNYEELSTSTLQSIKDPPKDNKATHGCISHVGSRFCFLIGIARQLLKMCYSNSIPVTAVHRSGKVNQRADLLSGWKRDQPNIRRARLACTRACMGPHARHGTARMLLCT